MSESTLSGIFESRYKRGSGCRVCGEPPAVTLGVRIQEIDEHGKIVGRHKSLSRVFCEAHAVEVWDALIGELERRVVR